MRSLHEEEILAVVVLADKRQKVENGGTTLFIASDEEEQNRLALNLSRILDAMVHDLENGVYVLVRH